MAKLNSLKDLFEDQLRVLYYAEKEFIKSVSKAIEKVDSEELKDSLMEHKNESEKQLKRLEKMFENLSVKAWAENCTAMNGIVAEIQEMINEDADPLVKDAAIISEIQKAIHFKVACYGTLKTYARILGHSEISGLMEETLKEEKRSDKKLTEIAGEINQKAV
jgi:ferritin-like metal-binding protein YciE